MQLARRNASNTSPKPDRRSVRDKTIAAIHIVWSKIRRDLKGDKEELRASRLAFMSQVLNKDVKSSRDVSDAKLGKVLDRMRELERAPGLFGVSSSEFKVQSSEHQTRNLELETKPAGEAEIVHLATDAQAGAIVKIFNYLKWSPEAREKFVDQRFQRTSPRLLTPKDANSLTMILLTIAAARDIKQQWKQETGRDVERVSRQMIRAEIPALKRRLDIDQQQKAGGSRQEAENEEEYFDDDEKAF
jgi:hypothetical protein